MDESWRTVEPKTIVKYPCGHGSEEVDGYGDKYLECPTCNKKYLLNFQRKSSAKIYGKS